MIVNIIICCEDSDGTRKWYMDGNLHREDGPAIETLNGARLWFLNGKLHRKDGPAIEYWNGIKHWYLNGKQVKPEDLPCDYNYIKLKYLS